VLSPNVFGKKKELFLNYLGQATRIPIYTNIYVINSFWNIRKYVYIPCIIPSSFLMFLYICFNIQKQN
jgi:hypothetical protein